VAHYGYDREQFLRMSVARHTACRDHADVRSRFLSHRTYMGEDRTWRHIKADGSLIDVSIYRRCLHYQGREASLVGIIDVTERRRAEVERDRSRDFLDRIIEAVRSPST